MIGQRHWAKAFGERRIVERRFDVVGLIDDHFFACQEMRQLLVEVLVVEFLVGRDRDVMDYINLGFLGLVNLNWRAHKLDKVVDLKHSRLKRLVWFIV